MRELWEHAMTTNEYLGVDNDQCLKAAELVGFEPVLFHVPLVERREWQLSFLHA
jgi:hypothetical protein